MNNPGIDLLTWERLRKKWAELQSAGHKLEIEFRLVADPKDENNILAIDVIQHINNDLITETVQRKPGEAYAALGITGLSMERITQVYKEMMHELHSRMGQRDSDLIVTMSPGSSTSGEVRGYMEQGNAGRTNTVSVNYRHYYVLNALGENMAELVGDSWTMVKAVYRSDALEFYFEY